ncbi:MAG: periplasmic heavy metal sensor [Aestuariivirga sp.]|uniref:periplasmic heavy metal sensor n=1 Tax=Aestuariivirga sp. TaxID=2650926 RepID=UPI0025BAD45C|nr:periplasmic heavy metal sensor [Aestuariivirga sp.]MCA3559795.1 periplasmic heavy metal sensor [Aestuariivirga sp.]
MNGTTVTPATAPRRVNWLKGALVASLAVNLLIAGAVAARWYKGPPPERYARLTQAQLIPRFFFRDLDRARRMELMAVLKAQDKDIRDGRQAVKVQVMALADALETEPYDEARVKSAVEGFTAKSEALFNTGADAALAVIGKLTPEERKLMAQHLRNREDRGRKPQNDKTPDGP